jgi:hypothetical protein
MLMLSILLGSLGLVIGSIAAAVAICWAGWTLFRLVRHPQWGALAIVTVLLVLFPKSFQNNELVRTAIVFAGVAAIALLFVGRDAPTPGALRRDRSADRQNIPNPAREEKIVSTSPLRRRYPVLIACMGEARQPSAREVKSVAKRILREAFPEREAHPQDGTRLYRDMLRAARATLGISTLGMRSGPALNRRGKDDQ